MTINEREENAYTLAVQAGLWGYPLAHRVEAFPRTLEAKGAGRNSFRKFDRLKSAEDRFVVTPNNLTIDGYALLDLADGPVVIHVPKLADERWFIVQIGDAFDDVVLNVGGSRPHVPGAYLITGPEFQGRLPGDMIQVSFRTNIGFVALRIAVNSADDLAGALQAQEGFTIRPLPDYLRDGITRAEPDYSPIPFPALTAPKELIHFDRLGAAMKYMLPIHADVNDTFVQRLGTIGLSVRKGFDWQGLDRSTLYGLRRQTLDSASDYVVYFEPGQTPPVAGMWNIAMYDDSMPEGDLASNWLPAPAGTFNLTMRYYTPLAPVLTKDYKLPAVRNT
jgi:hypothetical protein